MCNIDKSLEAEEFFCTQDIIMCPSRQGACLSYRKYGSLLPSGRERFGMLLDCVQIPLHKGESHSHG